MVVVRCGIMLVCGLGSLLLALPLRDFVAWCGGNHYPGTARQAGAVAMMGRGKSIATAVCIYQIDHHQWPATLEDVVKDGLLTKAQVGSYPKIDDLPDRRDILKMRDFEDWIYIRPQENSPDLPMVIAPRPYGKSMGRLLPKPRRIVVDRETVADSVEEEQVARILRKPATN